tara:strand:+ start:1815 stop:3080 length:1266 start_codon:yes stop_codon:yes gene_type:complete
MADAMNKVLSMMLPTLENNQMANLLGIDTVRKARGRGLLDAGLNMMALAGPRPATDNINPAMILKAGVDAGTQSYDNSINKNLSQLQTNMAMQDKLQSKDTFNLLMQSDYVDNEQKAFAMTLGPEKGAEFLSNVYMENQKAGNKFMDVTRIADGREMRVPQSEYVNNIDQYSTASKLAIEKKLDLAGVTDPEKRKEFILADLQGQTINIDSEGNISIGKGSLNNMSKKTQGSLEGDILSGTDALDQLNMIEATFEPDFYTIGGKGEAWVKNFFNKMDPSQVDAFTQRKGVHDQYVLQYFNAYRKWVTGVASGEKEMAWIQRSIPSSKDAPMTFESKLKSIKAYTEKAIARQKLALNKGLNIEPIGYNDQGMPIFDPAYKKFLNDNPYREPIQSRITYLKSLQYSDEQIAKILINEGYDPNE